MKTRLSTIFALALALVLALTSTCLAADWPAASIEFIVPAAPGGGTDVTVRAIAPYLEKALGCSIVVTNISGSGGIEAYTNMSTANPDGYTMGLIAMPAVPLAYAQKGTLKIDPMTDYVHLGSVVYNKSTVTVAADAPFNTLDDLIAYAKEHPGEVTVATTGATSLKGLVATSLADQAGIELTQIGFDGGSECITQILGGHITMSPLTVSEGKSYVEAGQLKVLAVAGDNRLEAYPDVPTFAEEELNLAFAGSTHAIVMPKGTPDEIANKVRTAIADICASEEFITYCANAGIDLNYSNYETLMAQLQSQIDLLKQ